jgi:hypothetical protein
VVLESKKGLNPSLSWFVQGFKGGQMVHNSSHRWYASRLRRSVILPPGEIDRVTIGQYFADLSGEKPRYVNVWRADLQPFD